MRTLWGEMAWQLGGKKAYARVKADDDKATNPGDVLRDPRISTNLSMNRRLSNSDVQGSLAPQS